MGAAVRVEIAKDPLLSRYHFLAVVAIAHHFVQPSKEFGTLIVTLGAASFLSEGHLSNFYSRVERPVRLGRLDWSKLDASKQEIQGSDQLVACTG